MAYRGEFLSSLEGKWHNFMIPYGKHYVGLSEVAHVAWQLRFRTLTQGPAIAEFEKKVADYVGAKYAVAVSSATAGLHLAFLVLDLEPSSEVLTTPLSFVASSNSIIYSGCKPRFIDIDSKTLNLDLNIAGQMLLSNNSVKALLPVHFAGLPCDMKTLQELNVRNLPIVEDAAHALGANYLSGSKVGSCEYSDMTVLSFHPVKSITTGEGGIVTTNNEKLYRRLLRLRSHGINKLDDSFENKQLSLTHDEINSWYYEMTELGFNYRLTELQAVLGTRQMIRLDRFISKRKELVNNYRSLLDTNVLIKFAQPAVTSNSAHHILPVRIDFTNASISRNELMARLRSQGVGSQVHYIPIPLQPYYKKLGFNMDSMPEAMNYYFQALSIPLFPKLKKRNQVSVIDALNYNLASA